MGKRVIRLTESELMQLVGRIVREQQETEMKEGFLDDSVSWFKDAVRDIAALFRDEYLDDMMERGRLRKLKMAASDINPREVMSNLPDFITSDEGKEAFEKADEKIDIDTLSEGYLHEGWFSDNVMKVLAKTGVVTGLGMLVSGFIAFISELKGYIDLPEFMVKVHEIVEASGCHAYCGPLAILAMVIGIVMAIKSADRLS